MHNETQPITTLVNGEEINDVEENSKPKIDYSRPFDHLRVTPEESRYRSQLLGVVTTVESWWAGDMIPNVDANQVSAEDLQKLYAYLNCLIMRSEGKVNLQATPDSIQGMNSRDAMGKIRLLETYLSRIHAPAEVDFHRWKTYVEEQGGTIEDALGFMLDITSKITTKRYHL